MVLTRSQDGESKGKEEEVEDPMAARMSRLEELVKEQNQKFYRTLSEMIEAIQSNRFDKVLDDPIAELKQLKETNGIVEYHEKFELLRTKVNLREDDLVRVYLDGLQIDTQVNVQMFQPQTIHQCFLIGKFYEYAHPRSNIDNVGILPLKKDGELKAEEDNEEEEIEVEMESIGLEDYLVHGAILEEESTPQFQVSIANSEIFKSSELREANSKLETLEYVVMNENENLEQEGVQKYVNMKFEVDGDAVSIARQVFDSMPLETNLLRNMIRETFSKTWWFKFKAMTKPRLPRTKSSNLELILMKEEPQSVIVDEVTFETQRCNLIQAKRLMRKTNSLCNDESVYVLEDLSSAEETWFLSDKSKDIQAGNFVDGKLHFDHYKVVKKRLLQSHIIQQRRKLHLPSNSWMFEYKRGHKKLLRPTLSGTVRMIVFPKKEAEQKIHPLIEYEFHEAPMGMNIQVSEVGIKSVCQFPSFHVWRWQTNLVMQQVMRNKKFRFSKRWWFKYKSVEEGIKRLHIQLRYKCMLTFEEWLRSWGSRESWRNHNLEASHIQSSFAFIDFQSGFGVVIIILHGVQQQGCRILMLHLKEKGRFRPLQSFSRLILLAFINLWFSKAYEISGLLKDSSDDGAENSPVLNFVAEQPLLWLQNYSKKIHIVSELENKKKEICYTSWMFKYKAPLKSIHDKLGKPKDRGALLIQQFKIKHKWRFKLLLSILALEIYLGSLVLVTNYAHQFHRLRLIILMGVGMFTNLRSQLPL